MLLFHWGTLYRNKGAPSSSGFWGSALDTPVTLCLGTDQHPAHFYVPEGRTQRNRRAHSHHGNDCRQMTPLLQTHARWRWPCEAAHRARVSTEALGQLWQVENCLPWAEYRPGARHMAKPFHKACHSQGWTPCVDSSFIYSFKYLLSTCHVPNSAKCEG
jgi:hypothetical protein